MLILSNKVNSRQISNDATECFYNQTDLRIGSLRQTVVAGWKIFLRRQILLKQELKLSEIERSFGNGRKGYKTSKCAQILQCLSYFKFCSSWITAFEHIGWHTRIMHHTVSYMPNKPASWRLATIMRQCLQSVQSVYMETTLVLEKLYLSSCFGSLSEEPAEQTAFLLQGAENMFKQTDDLFSLISELGTLSSTYGAADILSHTHCLSCYSWRWWLM